ncbi:MAG TPA: hypothetical protein PKE12_05435 [Kiritimatiellia bacterium]|nr:hypothetical protein [Kiritimatiellia bacterium]
MKTERNPFHELYVTETAGPKEFVQLFSPYMIEHTQLLFQPGNVVLKATQGCGKSMLLNLLKPEIRLAYRRANAEFPVPPELRRFISAGINLTRSGITYLGQRPIGRNKEDDLRLFPLYFADFLNYWVVADILKTLRFLIENPETVDDTIDINRLDIYAQQLAADDCWFGFLDGANNFNDLVSAIATRIRAYRSFHQFNTQHLPQNIQRTKTAIGYPISRAVYYMREAKLLPGEYNVFIRIDQHEVLSRGDDLRPELGREYRKIINKALSTRDPLISYRIGTRRYAWRYETEIFGTTAGHLEEERDYRIIDLDEKLRRTEDKASWVFPAYAEDIFRRRLLSAGVDVSPDSRKESLTERVFGSSMRPERAMKYYVGQGTADDTLDIDPDWPKEWADFLRQLFIKHPLSAKLAEAWLRQEGGQKRGKRRCDSPPPAKTPYPWDRRQWWRKERVRQALLQVASKRIQRFRWAGSDNILSLSAGSTLVFVSICQHIWDAFLRSQRTVPDEDRVALGAKAIPLNVQAVAIHTASTHWFRKVSEKPSGSDRERLVGYLGRLFRHKLLSDRAMSYPGYNGFSIAEEELYADEQVRMILNDASDFGDLFDAPHTTKLKDKKPRRKWYLNPILSPYFQIPETHVKEPMYISAKVFREWLVLSEKGDAPDFNNLGAAHDDNLDLFEHFMGRGEE